MQLTDHRNGAQEPGAGRRTGAPFLTTPDTPIPKARPLTRASGLGVGENAVVLRLRSRGKTTKVA